MVKKMSNLMKLCDFVFWQVFASPVPKFVWVERTCGSMYRWWKRQYWPSKKTLAMMFLSLSSKLGFAGDSQL